MGEDGLISAGHCVAEHPDMRIVVLTTYDTDTDILRAVGGR